MLTWLWCYVTYGEAGYHGRRTWFKDREMEGGREEEKEERKDSGREEGRERRKGGKEEEEEEEDKALRVRVAKFHLLSF